MGSLEWFTRNIYYTYIANNLSEKQMWRLKYILTSLEENKLKIFGHIFINMGMIAGVNTMDNFYMSYIDGYEPCGAEIAVFKWMNNLGVVAEDMVFELTQAVDINGYVTRIGRVWIKSALLPKIDDVCYAKIIEVIDDGFKVRSLIKAKVIGVIKYKRNKIEVHDILYGGIESFIYISYYRDKTVQRLKVSLYTDKSHLLYFIKKKKKIYLYNMQKGDKK